MATPFTAALLAGGQSSRMGQDKAGLLFEGEPLWKRQVRLLESLAPQELLISGRPDGPYLGSKYPVLLDPQPGLGPLSGLAALLEHTSTSRLLVLAVDMPWMNRETLQTLLDTGAGTVPEHDGWWEGTAAVYPREILPLVQSVLASQDHSFQALIRQALSQNWVRSFPVSGEARAFQSWNLPALP